MASPGSANNQVLTVSLQARLLYTAAGGQGPGEDWQGPGQGAGGGGDPAAAPGGPEEGPGEGPVQGRPGWRQAPPGSV